MAFVVPEAIDDYAHAMTPGLGGVFDALRQVTQAETELPQMQVGRVEGAFLAMLCRLIGARRVLEFGTFTGYSAMAMALALPDGGEVVTLDVDAKTNEIARTHWGKAGVDAKVVSVLGDARQTVQTLEGPFDLAFIDADKTGYDTYYENALRLLRPGGLIVVDNTLWGGRVTELVAGDAAAAKDDDTQAIHALNEKIRDDPRVDNVLLTVRDGMHLARKR